MERGYETREDLAATKADNQRLAEMLGDRDDMGKDFQVKHCCATASRTRAWARTEMPHASEFECPSPPK